MRKKKAIYNIIASSIAQVVSIVCGLIVPRLIIENYGSDVNGLVNSITQFLAYITLLESGLGPVILSVLYKPIAKKNKKDVEKILKSSENFFRKIAIFFVLYIVLLCFIYPAFINTKFDNLFTISLILIIGISTFAEYFLGITYSLYLQAEQKKYIISSINIVTALVNTILVCILVKSNSSIHIVKLVSSLIFVFRPILQKLYINKKYNINLSKSKETMKIKQKWDGLAQHIAGVIFSNTDVTLLTFFATMADISIYGVYNLVICAVRNFVAILTSSVEAGFGDMIAKKEAENLNRKFEIYELIYFSTITLVYSCSAVLIVPFVSIYTRNVTDANYIQHTFAFILVLAFFIHAIKSVYNTLAYSAGKFKETRKGAWIEAISNLCISFVLIFKYGIIGVAFGTLISVLIRCIEFMFFTSKNILKRNLSKTIVRVCICFVEFLVICLLGKDIITINGVSYISWILGAVKTVLISIAVIVPINMIVYKKESSLFFEIIKRKLKVIK